MKLVGKVSRPFLVIIFITLATPAIFFVAVMMDATPPSPPSPSEVFSLIINRGGVPQSVESKYQELAMLHRGQSITELKCSSGLEKIFVINFNGYTAGDIYYYDIRGKAIGTYEWTDMSRYNPPIDINSYTCSELKYSNTDTALEIEQDEARCRDNIDNDKDGATDFQDPDCTLFSPREADWVHCRDGKDNDGDGLIDKADLDCIPYLREDLPSFCRDREDNDLDGLIDVADPDCAPFYPVKPVPPVLLPSSTVPSGTAPL